MSSTIQADQDLLIQVLHNLINNAIKYNLPNGWIRIHARYQGDTVAVTISNRSNDIPAGERELIFARFHRGDPDHTHQIEGVGLGLSLSREIARAHGGDLTLDQAPASQTTFTLTLPKNR
ncbi:MAG: ATP-binding protein [Stigonema ocellatum SAG 48.90 = DSM 106950]|nr:ATP-binding protein [Stigonema ocellatum SAG 48.90 = DSM 106950]